MFPEWSCWKTQHSPVAHFSFLVPGGEGTGWDSTHLGQLQHRQQQPMYPFYLCVFAEQITCPRILKTLVLFCSSVLFLHSLSSFLLCGGHTGVKSLNRTPAVICQWAVFAIRNLLEENAQNQELVARLERQGPVDYSALRELGFQVEERDGSLLLKPVRKDS